MSVWTSKVGGWLEARVRRPNHAPEPDEAVRDAALLRMMGVMSVALLVIMTLIARAASN